MVSSKQPEGIRIPNLERPQVEDALSRVNENSTPLLRKTNLNAEITTINVVTEKKISSVCRIPANFKKFHQVKVLAVYVPTHRDGSIHFEEIRLISQHLRSQLYDPQRLLLRQAAFSAKMPLEELQIRLAAIVRGKKLVLGRRN